MPAQANSSVCASTYIEIHRVDGSVSTLATTEHRRASPKQCPKALPETKAETVALSVAHGSQHDTRYTLTPHHQPLDTDRHRRIITPRPDPTSTSRHLRPSQHPPGERPRPAASMPDLAMRASHFVSIGIWHPVFIGPEISPGGHWPLGSKALQVSSQSPSATQHTPPVQSRSRRRSAKCRQGCKPQQPNRLLAYAPLNRLASPVLRPGTTIGFR
ncbi:hypothetical protein K456DRAFT_1167413 [Colletotrichum gloeosporioides 23]|nr:hypothetical protein K456DRAFT_1167413 [Colletotrichum gloeosporioides 23]